MASFSLSLIPPSVILQLGQAFSIKLPEGMTADAHYDAALFHILTYQSGETTDPETGVSHLAMCMMHTAKVLGSTAIPGELAKGLKSPAANVKPIEEPPPPPKEEVIKKRFTADGFLILEEMRPNEMLQTDQARVRAGVSKARFSKLLQDHEFVTPAGVWFPHGEQKQGSRVKLYYAADVDKWVQTQELLRGKGREMTPEAKANMAAARDKYVSLPLLNPAVLTDGSYMTWDDIIALTGVSRSHLNNLSTAGEFPQPSAKVKKPGVVHPYSVVKAAEVQEWLRTSDHATAFRYRKQQAAAGNGGAANNGPPAEPQLGAMPTGVGTFRVPDDGSDAPKANGALPQQSAPGVEPEEAGEGEALSEEPKGWMKLRDVARYLGTTETGVERWIRGHRFPAAHRRNDKTKLKEWGAKQVIRWKRDNQHLLELT